MKFKRILSLILSMVLIFSVVSALSYAAEEMEEVYGIKSLRILNVLEITDLTTEQLGENIKRADFLKMMSIMAGYGAANYSNQLFADLSLEDEREAYVRALYDVGAITADKAGKVYPDVEIGLAEAASVAVKLAGYSLVAESKGGYPMGYVNVAKQKGILDKLPSNPYTILTNGMALQLVENTMKADLMVQTGFGSESGFEEKKGKNFLGAIFGVSHVEDVLEGVDISRVMGDNDVETLFIEIADLELEARKVKDIYDYLGYRVDVYYTVEKGDIPRLIYIEKSDKNTEMVIDIDDISSISNGRLKAYDEKTNREKTYSFTNFIPVIYNGVATKQALSESLISGKYGKVRFLDNTGDRKFDVVFVDAYETYIVSLVDTKENIIYDKFSSSTKIILDTKIDDPYTNIYDLEGNKIKAKRLKENDVLAVFSSAPDAYQGYINVYVVDKSVTGEIERIKDSGRKIIVEGIEYKVTSRCKTKFGEIFKPGNNVKLTLDYNGNIAWAEPVAELEEYMYGFIMATDTGKGMRDELKLKLYTATDEFVIFNIADSIKIDGKSYSSTAVDDILKVFHKASEEMFNKGENTIPDDCYSSLIRYIVNDDEKISVVDTILKGTSGVLAKSEDAVAVGDELFTQYGEELRCRITNQTLGKLVAYNTGSTVIMHPDPLDEEFNDMNDEENYAVRTAGNCFVNDEKYTVNACYTDSDAVRAGVIFMAYKSGNIVLAETPRLSVVNDIYEIYDEATDKVVTAVEVVDSGQTLQLKVKDTAETIVSAVDNGDEGLSAKMPVLGDNPLTEIIEKGLKKGDLITYLTDSKGYLQIIQLYFRADGRFYVNTSGATIDKTLDCTKNSHRVGFLYDKSADGLWVYFVDSPAELSDKSVLKSIDRSQCELVIGAPVYYEYVEGRKGEWEAKAGTYGDLKTYADTGEDCSIVYVQQQYRLPFTVYSL